MSANLYYVDLFNGRACDQGGAGVTFPEAVAGGTLSYALRFLEYVDGTYTQKDQDIAALRVSIGPIDTRPVSGGYRLKIGGGAAVVGTNTTEFLDASAGAYEISAALNALSGKQSTFHCEDVPGSVMIRRADGAAQVFSVTSNRLVPVSFARLTGSEVDGEWSYELRLTVAPLAFTDTSTRVLPNAPSIKTIIDGGTDSSNTFLWNEVQELYVPPTFQGIYQLRYGDFAKTTLLDSADGPEQIQTAINNMLLLPNGSRLGSVKVTNPLKDYAHIEFGGDLRGANVPQMTVSVFSAPQGDWTFDLPLDRAEMFFALREATSLTLPFEAEADFYIDPQDESAGTITRKLWQTTITVRRPQIMPDVATVPGIDWLRTNPVDYVPFAANQVVTGPQTYSTVIGNGGATQFAIAHGLATQAIANIIVRSNTQEWSVLQEGSDYTATITNNNEVSLEFDQPPAENGLLVYIQAAPTARQWDAHQHTKEQVQGLVGLLDSMVERISLLESLLPRAGVAGDTNATITTAAPISFELPGIGEVLPDANGMTDNQTLASQIVNTTGGQKYPSGTELSADLSKSQEQAAALKKDPDALPANVLYRVLIPGVGKTGKSGSAAVVGADGSVAVAAVPEEPSDPAVWPARGASKKWPMLLPAVEAATFGTAQVLPSSLTAGSVWQVQASDGLTLPGGNGRKAQFAAQGELFASDGRCFYKVTRHNGSNRYFPQEMDRELWRVFLGEEQFPSGAVLSVRGELRARMLGDFFDDDMRGIGRVDAGAQYMLRCEAVPVFGTALLGIADEPILIGETRVMLSPALETFAWSLSIRRETSGMVSSWTAYRNAAAGGNFTLPAAIRLRLTNFDIDDTSPDPRGQVAMVMPSTRLEITL